MFHKKTQTSSEDCHGQPGEKSLEGEQNFSRPLLPCRHRFSVSHIVSKCTTDKKERKYFNHFTGFNSYSYFNNSLLFLLPGLDRRQITYWGTKLAQESYINTEKLFDSDKKKTDESDSENPSDSDIPCNRMTQPDAHDLSCEDGYFFVLMRLRTCASNLDIGERFNTSDETVGRLILTWINYLYITLGSLKIWPYRDVLLRNAPEEFKLKYPNNIVIIDATELKVQVLSALQKHSECYSTYKSHTTLKCLLGVDAKGGIIFVSHFYERSISDKQLVQRSGFLEVLRMKLESGKIKRGDAIMADKGFDIEAELKKLGLKLNIPPFMKDKPGFDEDDVVKTQTVAQHRYMSKEPYAKLGGIEYFIQSFQ